MLAPSSMGGHDVMSGTLVEVVVIDSTNASTGNWPAFSSSTSTGN